MVCTDGVAVLLHFRSVRCYYFLPCLPCIGLPFPSYFTYLLSLHRQEAKGNNFARNKGLTRRPRPRHRAPRGFGVFAGSPSGPEGTRCVSSQAQWEVTAQQTPVVCSVPLRGPVPLVSLATHSHPGSGWPPDIVSVPHHHHPLAPGPPPQGLADCFWAPPDAPYLFCTWAEVGWINGQCLNGDQ